MPVLSYHNKTHSSTRQSSRTPTEQGCPAGWIWFSAGLLFGMFLAFLLYLRSISPAPETNILPTPVTQAPMETPVETPKTAQKTEEPQSFTFYDLGTDIMPDAVQLEGLLPEDSATPVFTPREDMPELTPEIINRPAQERPPQTAPKPRKPRDDDIVLTLPLPPADAPLNRNPPTQRPSASSFLEPTGEPTAGLVVQIGAFRDQRDAEQLSEKLQQLGFQANIYAATVNERQWYRVRLPAAANANAAQQLQNSLSQAGYSSILVR